jgi:WhiB family redox-sensing transcriptional regulator
VVRLSDFLIKGKRNSVTGKYPNFEEHGVPPCATIDPNLYFPERDSGFSRTPEYKTIKRICMSCPYQKPCLQWALDNHEIGVWGGTTANDRRLIRQRMRLREEKLKTKKSA